MPNETMVKYWIYSDLFLVFWGTLIGGYSQYLGDGTIESAWTVELAWTSSGLRLLQSSWGPLPKANPGDDRKQHRLIDP